MNEKRGEVIPFGKYKGQEVDRLLGDEEYTKWLLALPWFKQRYGNIYTVVINHYGQEPVETPAHNAMQVKFLREEWRLRFFAAANPKHAVAWTNRVVIGAVIRETMVSARNNWATYNQPSFGALGELLADAPSKMIGIGTPRFVDEGADVFFTAWSMVSSLPHTGSSTVGYRIELKPTMGDDFPEVLRQMKRNRCGHLLVQQYGGEGATEEEVVEFFKHANIRVLFERELHAVSLPDIDVAEMAGVIEEARAFVESEMKQWREWKENREQKQREEQERRDQERRELREAEKAKQDPRVQKALSILDGTIKKVVRD